MTKIDSKTLNENEDLEIKYNDVLKKDLTQEKKNEIIQEYKDINKKI